MSLILLTGGAGFIGFHTAKALLERGDKVISIDSFNEYYDKSLKNSREQILLNYSNFTSLHKELSDYNEIEQVFKENKIDKICHLAAQAGVRYSIESPFTYEKSNILATLNLLELAKKYQVKDFIFASSSSVYGSNTKIPFSETDKVDTPISLYAATKKSCEEMAFTYHHLFGLNCTGLRFFTVYGPFGRPDMALFKFTKNIIENKEIEVYNNGKMYRDFTFVTDIVSGILSALDKAYPYEIFNIGNSETVELNYFIEVLEKELGKKAKIKYLPIQPGDVLKTYADISKANKLLNYQPAVKIEQGIKEFVNWYKEYYQ